MMFVKKLCILGSKLGVQKIDHKTYVFPRKTPRTARTFFVKVPDFFTKIHQKMIALGHQKTVEFSTICVFVLEKIHILIGKTGF